MTHALEVLAALKLIERVANFGVGQVDPADYTSDEIVLFGHFGQLRFFKIIRPDDVFDPYDHPTGAVIDALSSARADTLAVLGGAYINHRFAGRTDDIGSRLVRTPHNFLQTRNAGLVPYE